MRKFVSISVLLVCFVGMTAAAQPKILEVTDNFGNTFEFSEDETWDQVDYRGEVVVSDDTKISLCVTKIKAENKENVELNWRISAPENIEDNRIKIDNNGKCITADIRKSDYQDYFLFRVKADNGDDIRPRGGDEDYMAGIYYRNLKLEGKTDNSQTYTYDTVKLSRSKYQELKNGDSSSTSDSSTPEGQKLVDKDEWEELQERPTNNEVENLEEKIQEKNNKISRLQEEISNLEQRISELQSTIEKLNQSEDKEAEQTSEAEEGNRSGPPEGVPANQDNNGEDLPGNQQAEENRPGFVNSLLGSIFG